MMWSALLDLIIAMFGPKLLDWLRDLFAKASLSAAGPAGFGATAGVSHLFAQMRAETWVWQFGARSRLRILERIATAHAAELYVALRSGVGAPRLTDAETIEIEPL